MENFNGNSLKAAVKTYSQLHTDGKSEDAVKAEIAKDDRKFTDEQINKIYDAILNPEPPKDKVFKYVVKQSFRDIKNFDLEHEVGKDVSDFDPKRLAALVGDGHVEKVEIEQE